MEIISRSLAINEGMTTYYTGKPCKNGHTAKRYVKSGTCSACIADHVGRTRSKIPGPGETSVTLRGPTWALEQVMAVWRTLVPQASAEVTTGPEPFDADEALRRIHGPGVAAQLKNLTESSK